MKKFEVVGSPARFGIGTLLSLTEAQYRARAHMLNLVNPKKKPSGDVIEVTAGEPVEFKVGEVIGLREVPKSLGHCVVPHLTEEEKKRVADEEEARRNKEAEDTQKRDTARAAKAFAADARGEWDKSADLQKQFPKFEDYLEMKSNYEKDENLKKEFKTFPDLLTSLTKKTA